MYKIVFQSKSIILHCFSNKLYVNLLWITSRTIDLFSKLNFSIFTFQNILQNLISKIFINNQFLLFPLLRKIDFLTIIAKHSSLTNNSFHNHSQVNFQMHLSQEHIRALAYMDISLKQVEALVWHKQNPKNHTWRKFHKYGMDLLIMIFLKMLFGLLTKFALTFMLIMRW